MRQRLVYMDFGDGFANVSDSVKYETLKYSRRGFNDSYRYAQNDCSFSLTYSEALWNSIRAVTTDIQVRIVDLIDTDIAVPVFYGHAKPTKARTYTGNLNEMFIQIRATDEIDLFSVPIGDIVYADCAVLNPLDPTNSIVHKLALIAGWTTGKVCTDVTISTTIARFAPPDPETTVLEALSDLLFEYGYVLNLNESGIICPIKWNVQDASPTITFNDSNCIKSVQVEDTIKEYDSAKVTYYELGQAQRIKLYTDGNCGYTDDGAFAGVAIYNNTYYPPEANVIDDTTGTYQIVEQEYTDDSIRYFTNKAIKENLDYSYKAFSSDFSAIVATEDHFADARVDSGVTVTREFNNKKCKILYHNTTGSTKYLWYNNVYGTVWYKSTERTTKRALVASPKKQYEYTSKYIFNKDVADALVKGLAAQYEVGKTLYTVTYDTSFVPGTICQVTLGDGTNQTCIVRDYSWDEYTQLFTLKLQSCSLDRGDITARTSTVKVNVTPASPFSLLLSTKQLSIPYNGTTPDFTTAYIDIKVYRDNLDVTADWSLSATPTAVSGTLSGTRYSITGISSTTGSVTIMATNATWGTIQDTVAVIKAKGEKGEKGDPGIDGTDSLVTITDPLETALPYTTGQKGIFNSYIYKWTSTGASVGYWTLIGKSPVSMTGVLRYFSFDEATQTASGNTVCIDNSGNEREGIAKGVDVISGFRGNCVSVRTRSSYIVL